MADETEKVEEPKASYSDDLIGKWVARSDSELHKVESVIRGSLVTNCGRKLQREGYQDVTGVRMTLPRYCKQCLPNRA